MNKSRGTIIFNGFLILMLVVIGVTIYLMSSSARNEGRNIGVVSPQVIKNEATAPAKRPNAVGFSDGLGRANQSTEFPLDEFGAGVARADVYFRDLNNDGIPDRITRTHVETGTAHFQYKYTVELGDGNGYIDITPPDLYTVEGAECSLQKIQFVFAPDFQIVKISRPWHESWTTPTPATRTTYGLANDELYEKEVRPLKTICNVADLF